MRYHASEAELISISMLEYLRTQLPSRRSLLHIEMRLENAEKAMPDEIERPPPRCFLLELPAELRNRIYEAALVHNTIFILHPSGKPVDDIEDGDLGLPTALFRPSEPSLTRTSHQVRDETLPIYYGQNTYRDSIRDPYCTKLLRFLTPERRLMLKRVQIEHHPNTVYPGGRRINELCAVKAKDDLEQVHTWLQKNQLQLSEGTMRVAVKLQDNGPLVWTNDPRGRCELRRCHGNDFRVLIE